MPDSTANAIELGRVSERVATLEKDRDTDRKKNSEAHSDFYRRIGELESGQTLTDEKFSRFEKTQDEIRNDIKSLLSQDGNKWKNISTEVVKYATLLILGYVAYQLGIAL